MINYRWSDWIRFIDGWIPKFALFFPIVGYLILFNDAASSLFTFEGLTNKAVLESGLTGEMRLKFLYFGLMFLGVSNFVYILRKPHVLRLGQNPLEYAEEGL